MKTEANKKKMARGLGLLYALALMVLVMTAGLRADWPYGCCNGDSSECEGASVCDTGPTNCECGIFSCTEDYCYPINP